MGNDSAHRCKQSAHCLTVGANIVRLHNVKSYVFPIVNPVPTATISHTTETAVGRNIAAAVDVIKFVTPKNGTRNTVNGSSTEFAGRISAVITNRLPHQSQSSADAIVSRHIAVLLFRHSLQRQRYRTINTALTQNFACARGTAVKPVRAVYGKCRCSAQSCENRHEFTVHRRLLFCLYGTCSISAFFPERYCHPRPRCRSAPRRGQ